MTYHIRSYSVTRLYEIFKRDISEKFSIHFSALLSTRLGLMTKLYVCFSLEVPYLYSQRLVYWMLTPATSRTAEEEPVADTEEIEEEEEEEE
jgi:hypothetical protein